MPHMGRGPTAFRHRPCGERPDQRERLHEASEHGEDLAAPIVRDDLLDQGHVADETDPVADAENDGPDTADREVRADGAQSDPGRRDEKRGAIAPVHRQALDEPHRDDVADHDPGGRERDEDAEPDVAGAVRVGRQDDLRDVDPGVGERRPAPDQEDRGQVAVVPDE